MKIHQKASCRIATEASDWKILFQNFTNSGCNGNHSTQKLTSPPMTSIAPLSSVEGCNPINPNTPTPPRPNTTTPTPPPPQHHHHQHPKPPKLHHPITTTQTPPLCITTSPSPPTPLKHHHHRNTTITQTPPSPQHHPHPNTTAPPPRHTQ